MWGNNWCFGQKATWYQIILGYILSLIGKIGEIMWEVFIIHTYTSIISILTFCAKVYIILLIKGRPSTLEKKISQTNSSIGNSHNVSTNIYRTDRTKPDVVYEAVTVIKRVTLLNNPASSTTRTTSAI